MSDELLQLRIEVEQEVDGRWIAEVPELPGVLAYGASELDAVNGAVALTFRVLADRLDHGEQVPSAGVSFSRAA